VCVAYVFVQEAIVYSLPLVCIIIIIMIAARFGKYRSYLFIVCVCYDADECALYLSIYLSIHVAQSHQ